VSRAINHLAINDRLALSLPPCLSVCLSVFRALRMVKKEGRMSREKKLASVKLPLPPLLPPPRSPASRGISQRHKSWPATASFVTSSRLAEILDRLDRGPSTVTVVGNSAGWIRWDDATPREESVGHVFYNLSPCMSDVALTSRRLMLPPMGARARTTHGCAFVGRDSRACCCVRYDLWPSLVST